MTRDDCPSTDVLGRYVEGALAESAADTLNAHLATCAACLARLDELAARTNPLIAALRRPVLANPANARLDRVVGKVLATAVVAAGPTPGTVLGGYRLLEEIGQGGMGRVYRARHPRLDREVALKVLRPGMDTADFISRFEAERQALALMDHPNIARVFDGGLTEDGRPFFVMELVLGVAVSRYCDEHRLDLRRRLELFGDICSAVQHAHQKGIIHRDLKPSNVLVTEYDGKPMVKVIDFGVAKALERRDGTQTEAGMLLGTPQYMSPEQAERTGNDIDTRSDIYALGVMLYELLTGDTPIARTRLRGTPVLEVLRLVREEEPACPSSRLISAETKVDAATRPGINPATLAKQVRGEIDWIVMKCLDKDRNRRYETANSLAADLQRYLADEPVQACPPSLGYQLKKLIRRHAGLIAIASILSVAILLAVSSIGWAIRDRSARRELARQDTEARQGRIAERVQTYLTDAAQLSSELKWPQALDAARRAQQLLADLDRDALAEQVRSTVRDLELVRDLDAIRAERSEWVEGQFDYRGAADRYAKVFLNLGIDLDRLPVAESGSQLKARSAVLAALIPALHEWAVCRRALGDEPGADRLLTIIEGIDPDPWRQKFWQLQRDGDLEGLVALTQSDELAKQSAATLVAVSRALTFSNRAEASLKVLFVAQRRCPTDFWVHFQMGAAYKHLKPPSPEQAAGCYRAALALQPHNSAAWNNLGNTLIDLGKLDDARACLDRAIELNSRNAYAHNNLGRCLAAQEKVNEAIIKVKKAIELQPLRATFHYHQGLLLEKKNEPLEAITAYKQAIRLEREYADAYSNVGKVLVGLNRHEEAFKYLVKAIQLEPTNAFALNNLGCCYLKMGNYDEALGAVEKSLALDSKNAPAHINRGVALAGKQRFGEAVAAYDRALQLDAKNASTHASRGQAAYAQSKIDEAIRSWRKAIELNPNDARSHHNLGLALADHGKYDDAIDYFRKAIALEPTLGISHGQLGILLCDRKKDYDGAIAAFQQAITLQPKDASLHFNMALAQRLHDKGKDAIASLREAIRLNPAYARAHTHLAINLTMSSDLELRNATEGLAAARKGVELAQQSDHAWLVLGFANYRAGKWKDCIAAMEKAMSLHKTRKTGNPRHWYFVAMSHWQLGDKDTARTWFDKAEKALANSNASSEELQRIAKEAATLMSDR